MIYMLCYYMYVLASASSALISSHGSLVFRTSTAQKTNGENIVRAFGYTPRASPWGLSTFGRIMWVADVLYSREALTNTLGNCFKMALLVFQQQFPYSCWTDDLHWRKCGYKPCYCYSHCSAVCNRVSVQFSTQQQCVTVLRLSN